MAKDAGHAQRPEAFFDIPLFAPASTLQYPIPEAANPSRKMI